MNQHKSHKHQSRSKAKRKANCKTNAGKATYWHDVTVYLNHLFSEHWGGILLGGAVLCCIFIPLGTMNIKPIWWGCIGTIIFADMVIFALFAVAAARQGTAAEPNLLVPADEPDPAVLAELVKNIPSERSALRSQVMDRDSGLLKIFFGLNAAFTSRDSQPILKIDGQELLSISRTAAGISVDAKIFDADGKIVAQIENSEFFINQNAAFRIKRPDSHSLIVYDNRAEKVLDIRYLNRSSVRVNGVFRYGKLDPCIMTDTIMTDPHGGSFAYDIFGESPDGSILEFDARGVMLR